MSTKCPFREPIQSCGLSILTDHVHLKLHLATCTSLQPYISLMNYTYLASTPFSSFPTIVMTTNPSSRKTQNLQSNPNVSLLVHDWVSHRPATRSEPHREGSPPPAAASSSLASLLLGLNTAALGRISATINGTARILDEGGDEEKWCREMHVDNHRFREGEDQGSGVEEGYFLEGEEVRVVVVKITDGRVADWKGGITDFVIGSEPLQGEALVNGMP